MIEFDPRFSDFVVPGMTNAAEIVDFKTLRNRIRGLSKSFLVPYGTPTVTLACRLGKASGA
ncbi:hypothetical protein [Brevundimonas sp. ZS04]|uniref:hypothetical protein n=1 Tax=Brevundimonas sp. ZS04 TaxID=1906854 RepID=UPI001178ADD2|nr:hypothetical protein [Brevundimonas sp. ZS04]